MEERFYRLTIDTALLPQVEAIKINSDLLFDLLSFYRRFPFYHIYGPRALDYICGLSLRYACWTLPHKLKNEMKMIQGYSLWLSLVWFIDGVYDKHKSVDPREIIRIINEEPIQERSDFLDVVSEGYRWYLRLISRYREIHPQAYQELKSWTVKYLENLGKPPREFAEWRLIDGAMMCVVWHLILFLDPAPFRLDYFHQRLFEQLSLIVSYHNDILSLDRDLVQSTPNLVIFFPGILWEKLGAAVEYVERLYEQVASDFARLDSNQKEYIGTICLSILEGSHNWANSEERYRVGREILESLWDDDQARFEQILKIKNQTAGDPD